MAAGESLAVMSPGKLGLGRLEMEGDGYSAGGGRNWNERRSAGADVTADRGMLLPIDCANPTGSELCISVMPL